MAKQATRSEDIRRLFDLPADEVLIEEFNCALVRKSLLQGKIYIFDSYLCFYSNIFGYEKLVIPLSSLTHVQRAKTAGVFPNAIEIYSEGNKHFFTSFINREDAYRFIVFGWARKSNHARLYLGKDSPDLDPETSAVAQKWETRRRNSESEPTSPRGREVNSQNEEGGPRVARNSSDEDSEVPSNISLQTSGEERIDDLSHVPTIQHSNSFNMRVPPSGGCWSDEIYKVERVKSLDREGGAAITDTAGLLFSSKVRGELRSQGGLVHSLVPAKVEPTSLPRGDSERAGMVPPSIQAMVEKEQGPQREIAVKEAAEIGLPVEEPPSPSTCIATPVALSPSKEEEKEASAPATASAPPAQTEPPATPSQESMWDAADQREPPPIPSSMHRMFSTDFQVSANTIFNLFFSDGSVAFMQKFHESRGDQDVKCTNWSKSETGGGYTRDLTFKHPINLIVGPKAAICRQAQKIQLFSNGAFVMITEQKMSDIPFSDNFSIVTRWDVTPSGSDGPETCQVIVSMEVPFTKKVWLQGAIEKGALNESRQVYQSWNQKVREHLASHPEAAGDLASRATGKNRSGAEKSGHDLTARICQLLAEGKLCDEDADEIRRMLKLDTGADRESTPGSQSVEANGEGADRTSSHMHFQGTNKRKDWFGRRTGKDWLASGVASLRKAARQSGFNGGALLIFILLSVMCLEVAILFGQKPGSLPEMVGGYMPSFPPSPPALPCFGVSGQGSCSPALAQEAATWWEHRLRQLQEQVEFELARVRVHLKEQNDTAPPSLSASTHTDSLAKVQSHQSGSSGKVAGGAGRGWFR